MQIPDRFQIVRTIGLGATSEVYEAVNADTGKRIALKSFSPLVLSDPESVLRLEAEIAALNQLHHPNIVSLIATHSAPNFFALELELVSGSDLRKWAQAFDITLMEPKLWLLAQVARGLGAAHEIGVLHRDLKPENVLVSDDGDVKITDFGLSRSISRLTLTRIGLLVGSLGYMSPECINGLRADVRSDLFSYGVIAYELLCGRAPFEADTPQALIKQITEGRFTPLRQLVPSLPPEVATVLEACLSQDADQRPESIWVVEAALMTCLQGTGLLPHCRALVAPKNRAAAFAQALALKHDSLHERIERLSNRLSDEPQDTKLRSMLLTSLHELRALFPEDPLVSQTLNVLAAPNTNRYQRTRIAVGVLIFALIGAGVWWMTLRSSPTLHGTERGSEQSSTSLNSPERLITGTRIAPAALTTGDAPGSGKTEIRASRPTPHATPVRRGRIVFELDSDVRAYVDGELVPPSEWAGYETTAGKKRIRLVKEGFDPIDNTVEVHPRKTAVIRAKR